MLKRITLSILATAAVILICLGGVAFAAAVGPGWFLATAFTLVLTYFFYDVVFKDVN